MLKTEHLPRQAWDKHREKLKHKDASAGEGASLAQCAIRWILGAQNTFCAPFCTENRKFYQARLGTNQERVGENRHVSAEHEGVSAAIPGASKPAQVDSNMGAGELAPLSGGTMAAAAQVYKKYVGPVIDGERW